MSSAQERPRRDLEAARRTPPGPRRREALRGIAGELEAGGVRSPRVEAERLVAHALRISRGRLLAELDERMDPESAGRLARLVRRRLAGEPLQYIEGTVQFRELELLADPRALIPRPETEQLVERVARWARTRAGPRDVAALLGSVLDVGTGSGAIALSLVSERVAARAVGLDVSAEALVQAAENRQRVGLGDRVQLRLVAGSPWTALDPGERFDAIVSNPPYVPDAVWESLPREIREHEPREALAGGEDGLELVREVVAGAGRHLEPGGALFLEIGEDQGESVTRLFRSVDGWGVPEVLEDLSDRDRFVQAVWGSSRG